MFGLFNSVNQPNETFNDGFVTIQVQEGVAHWRNIKSIINNTGMIAMSMMEVSQMYPQYRVRAVDQNGRLLDMI